MVVVEEKLAFVTVLLVEIFVPKSAVIFGFEDLVNQIASFLDNVQQILINSEIFLDDLFLSAQLAQFSMLPKVLLKIFLGLHANFY